MSGVGMQLGFHSVPVGALLDVMFGDEFLYNLQVHNIFDHVLLLGVGIRKSIVSSRATTLSGQEAGEE